MSFDLRDDLDALSGLAEDVADVHDVLRTSNERREHNVDLPSTAHTQRIHRRRRVTAKLHYAS